MGSHSFTDGFWLHVPTRVPVTMKRNITLFSLIAAFFSVGPGQLHAQSRDELLTRQLLEGLPQDQHVSAELSPSQAARQAKLEHGGEVLSIEQETQGYRVKLLVDGEVRFVSVMNARVMN